MAKFIKSIFQTPEKRKSAREGETEKEDVDVSPLDHRRKLSMSRSGRLKQAYRKRHSLSLELYGGEDMQKQEKPKSKEYHVNPINSCKSNPDRERDSNQRKLSTQSRTKIEKQESHRTPEEEIDNAFEIIDKT